MPMNHEEIQSLLPEYLAEGLPLETAAEVKAHIASCGACQDGLAVLVEIQQLAVADPGETFWRALPGKVALEAETRRRQKRSPAQWAEWIWRPVPVAGLALLLVMLIFARSGNPPADEYDAAYLYSVGSDVIDYGVLSESDIPYADMDGADRYAAEIELSGDSFDGYRYHREVVSLTSDEIDTLYKTLKKDLPGGG